MNRVRRPAASYWNVAFYTDNRSKLTDALGLRDGSQVGAIDQDIGREKGRTITMPDTGAGMAIG